MPRCFLPERLKVLDKNTTNHLQYFYCGSVILDGASGRCRMHVKRAGRLGEGDSEVRVVTSGREMESGELILLDSGRRLELVRVCVCG